MKGKILHVCNTDKFIPPFISFIENNIGLEGHLFYLIGDHDRYPVTQNSSVEKVPAGAFNHFYGYIKLAFYMQAADKIILHGLSKKKIEQLLFFMPWVLKKCYWIIWGNDLYQYKLARHKKSWKKREFFRRPVIRKMGHLVTYVKGDVALAREWYGAEGEYHECLAYPSNLYKEHQGRSNAGDGRVNIQVGNSADPSNQHAEAFAAIAPYKAQHLHLYVPLSYGSKKNAVDVEQQAHELFDGQVTLLKSFMPLEDYQALLESVDIAMFNHERQQAMGNIITLLGMGKTVYLRSGVAHKQLFDDLGVKCFDVNDFSLERLSREEKEENMLKIKAYFSKSRLTKQLKTIFAN